MSENARFDSSAGDAVRAASRLIEEQVTELAALRAALIDGEQSGPSTPFDFEAFIERMRVAAVTKLMAGRYVPLP